MSDTTILDASVLAKLRDLFDEQFQQEMVRLFFEYVPVKLAEAKTASQRGDLPGVKAAAHTIKSSANKVGAVAVTKLAAQIEELAAQGNPEALRLVSELDAACTQVYPLLLQHVKS
jgi:HPt (histidine-containing phosphotransfer) domain-containing protein